MCPGSLAGFRLRAFLATLAVALGLTGWLATASAHAASTTKMPFSVAVGPSSAVAGSTGNTLVFTFFALNSANGNVAVTVPTGAGWTAPQNRFPAQPGYVSVAPGTCKGTTLAGVGGARTATVSAKCKQGQSFRLTYAGAKAPTVVGPYTFVTRASVAGSVFVPSPQPVVTVGPAAAKTLSVTGLVDAAARTHEFPTVTARDAFGNVATGYRGTIRLAVGLVGWGFIGGNVYTFTAGDAGTHTFEVIPHAAGAQTFTVTDQATSTITGSQAVTISPGPTAVIQVGARTNSGLVVGQTVRLDMTFSATDLDGNVTPDWSQPVHAVITNLHQDLTAISQSIQDIVLVNGQKTIGVSVEIAEAQLFVQVEPSSAGLPNFGVDQFQFFGVLPDHGTVQLSNSTPNADGTLDASLDIPATGMKVDASTVTFNFSATTENANGTTQVPFTGTTEGGDQIAGLATITTPANPVSGALAIGTTSAVGSGSQVAVTGCVNGQYLAPKDPSTGETATLPAGGVSCPSSFAGVNVTNSTTATVVFVGQDATAQPQAAVLTNIIDSRCFDETKVWDAVQNKCVPKP
jgi:hypothetical protein